MARELRKFWRLETAEITAKSTWNFMDLCLMSAELDFRGEFNGAELAGDILRLLMLFDVKLELGRS
jgi:hypothetical protein